MYWSKSFMPTLKENPQEAESISHRLLLRAGMIRMLMSGVYSYLPLGLRVLSNIEGIIRQEMNSCGASEVLLPALQPLELWQRSGRDKDIGEVMIRFIDRRGRKICLGPTHEEVITDLVKSNLSSYKQLPLILYQIQTKFRDELRPRFGLIRGCEFIMKDAYSFDKDEAGLNKNYNAMHDAYKRIFRRCGLNVLITEAETGVMGGSGSHEFMVPAEEGEDIVLLCPGCGFVKTFKEKEQETCPKCSLKLKKLNTIEIGHIFKLGTKYSVSLGANFVDEKGKLQPAIMGCYGIGVSRLISSIIAQNHDENGIIWPGGVAPYKIAILPLDVTEKKIMQLAETLYNDLAKENIEALLDDRDERAGVKFKDAELIGVPVSIIIGLKNLSENKIEIRLRLGKQAIFLKSKGSLAEIKNVLERIK